MKLLVNALRFINKVFNFFYRRPRKFLKPFFDYLYLSYYGVETKLGYVELLGLPIIHRQKNARIIIGAKTTLVSKSRYNAAGINHPVILAATRENAVLNIHGSFGASGSAIVAMESVEIELGAALGANSHVYDTDFHPIGWHKNDTILIEPVKIGKNVWVAANCLILKGVTIGDNCVIASGTIVTKSLESDSLYAGVPAKFIRKI
jgi:acetyltransferase-like isoleucine patch superfamily enzyme